MIIPPSAKPMVMTAENAASVRKETKTETRRVIPLPEGLEPYHIDEWREIEPGLWEPWGDCGMCNGVKEPKAYPIRARYKVGDLVYIAEPYTILEPGKNDLYIGVATERVFVEYGDLWTQWVKLTVDEWAKWKARKFPYRRSPGRFMYRSLARSVHEVEGVRAERLKEIRAVSCLAEGIHVSSAGQLDACDIVDEAIDGFRMLWDSIHVKDGHDWDANPWNFVYRLKKWEGA